MNTNTQWQQLLHRVLDGGELTDAEAETLHNALTDPNTQCEAQEWLRLESHLRDIFDPVTEERVELLRRRLLDDALSGEGLRTGQSEARHGTKKEANTDSDKENWPGSPSVEQPSSAGSDSARSTRGEGRLPDLLRRDFANIMDAFKTRRPNSRANFVIFGKGLWYHMAGPLPCIGLKLAWDELANLLDACRGALAGYGPPELAFPHKAFTVVFMLECTAVAAGYRSYDDIGWGERIEKAFRSSERMGDAELHRAIERAKAQIASAIFTGAGEKEIGALIVDCLAVLGRVLRGFGVPYAALVAEMQEKLQPAKDSEQVRQLGDRAMDMAGKFGAPLDIEPSHRVAVVYSLDGIRFPRREYEDAFRSSLEDRGLGCLFCDRWGDREFLEDLRAKGAGRCRLWLADASGVAEPKSVIDTATTYSETHLIVPRFLVHESELSSVPATVAAVPYGSVEHIEGALSAAIESLSCLRRLRIMMSDEKGTYLRVLRTFDQYGANIVASKSQTIVRGLDAGLDVVFELPGSVDYAKFMDSVAEVAKSSGDSPVQDLPCSLLPQQETK